MIFSEIRKSKLMLIVAIVLAMSACAAGDSGTNDENAEQAGDSGESETQDLQPADSSGGTGEVDILFGTHIGNPSMNLMQDATLEVSDQITLDQVLINFAAIKMKPNAEPSAEEEAVDEAADTNLVSASDQAAADPSIAWAGPYRYDLINNTTSPEIESVELPDGTYRRVEFRAHQLKDGEDDDPLTGHSIYISGTFAGDDGDIAFSVRHHVTEKFRVVLTDGVFLDADGALAVGLTFDVAQWFEGLDIAAAKAGDDGAVDLSKSANQTIWKDFLKNLKASTRVGTDDNGDGEIDEDEIAEGEAEVDDEADDDDDEDEDDDDEEQTSKGKGNGKNNGEGQKDA